MALYGQIKEFKKRQFMTIWIDCFYLEANEVTVDAKKRAVLLTVIGPQQFRLLKDLSAPAKPQINHSMNLLSY